MNTKVGEPQDSCLPCAHPFAIAPACRCGVTRSPFCRQSGWGCIRPGQSPICHDSHKQTVVPSVSHEPVGPSLVFSIPSRLYLSFWRGEVLVWSKLSHSSLVETRKRKGKKPSYNWNSRWYQCIVGSVSKCYQCCFVTFI